MYGYYAGTVLEHFECQIPHMNIDSDQLQALSGTHRTSYNGLHLSMLGPYIFDHLRRALQEHSALITAGADHQQFFCLYTFPHAATARTEDSAHRYRRPGPLVQGSSARHPVLSLRGHHLTLLCA